MREGGGFVEGFTEFITEGFAEIVYTNFRRYNGRTPDIDNKPDQLACDNIATAIINAAEIVGKEPKNLLIDIAEQITRDTGYFLRQRGVHRHYFILVFTTRAWKAGYQEPDIIEYLKPLSEAEAKEVRETIRGAE
ncbi:MAG: hypothetical protein ACR2PY_06985 [Salinispira sp.]